ncbi:flagellar hook capping FlgD N-terminal domain-containing protein [uncultured Jannaschia sp.]|uniref:flagellar hook capping FlgD N-terminal domain-containing protein n=1 Tax=uncultured Jannaschia sp. TaxID=293347 RepID=UPI0026221D62|nr:flagellar hook capping FlgD N-terminal domain-containing protein [uncultured Jannaschia sp.]
MDVTSPTSGAQAGPARAPNAADDTAAAKTSGDFEMFLKLLTTQIRNQDPMEPADSTEYTAQLATFSNVEQAVQTNDLLKSMITRFDSQQATSAASFIGMEVRHEGPVAHDGTSNVLHTAIKPAADRAELVVVDGLGNEVGRYAIDPDAESIGWPSAAQAGSVPPGLYNLHVDSWAGDLQLDRTPVAHYASVSEVVLGDDGTEIVLKGGVRLPMSDMQSIRAAQ